MNSHQRRKLLRRLKRQPSYTPRVFIKTWAELAQLPESPTHRLEINVDGGNGWIHKKGEETFPRYLSTHTFYGTRYQHSTRLIRRCGFNVALANWHSPENIALDLPT